VCVCGYLSFVYICRDFLKKAKAVFDQKSGEWLGNLRKKTAIELDKLLNGWQEQLGTEGCPTDELQLSFFFVFFVIK